MNDFDRSDFMDRVVFWFAFVCWIVFMGLLITDSI